MTGTSKTSQDTDLDLEQALLASNRKIDEIVAKLVAKREETDSKVESVDYKQSDESCCRRSFRAEFKDLEAKHLPAYLAQVQARKNYQRPTWVEPNLKQSQCF